MKQDPRAKTFILSMVAAFVILHFSLNYMKTRLLDQGVKESESLVLKAANSWNSTLYINYYVENKISPFKESLTKSEETKMLTYSATTEQKKDFAVFILWYCSFWLAICMGCYKLLNYFEDRYERRVRQGLIPRREAHYTGSIRYFPPHISVFGTGSIASGIFLICGLIMAFPFVMNIFISLVVVAFCYKILQSIRSIFTMNQEEEV